MSQWAALPQLEAGGVPTLQQCPKALQRIPKVTVPFGVCLDPPLPGLFMGSRAVFPKDVQLDIPDTFLSMDVLLVGLQWGCRHFFKPMAASHILEDAPAPGGHCLVELCLGTWGVTAISGWHNVAQRPSFRTHPWLWTVHSPLSIQGLQREQTQHSLLPPSLFIPPSCTCSHWVTLNHGVPAEHDEKI